MSIQDAIRSIIKGVDKNNVFDTHFVIRQLIKINSDEYLNFAGSIKTETNISALTDGHIGQMIRDMKDLVEKMDYDFYSESFNGKLHSNAGWRRK